MTLKRPRADRVPLVGSIELIDVWTGAQVRGQITNLSLSGCRIESQHVFALGSRVRVRIVYRGATFVAFGRVARIQVDGETGIAFMDIEPKDRALLDNWLARLRNPRVSTSKRTGPPNRQD
jgi:hypothetical protein